MKTVKEKPAVKDGIKAIDKTTVAVSRFGRRIKKAQKAGEEATAGELRSPAVDAAERYEGGVRQVETGAVNGVRRIGRTAKKKGKGKRRFAAEAQTPPPHSAAVPDTAAPVKTARAAETAPVPQAGKRLAVSKAKEKRRVTPKAPRRRIRRAIGKTANTPDPKPVEQKPLLSTEQTVAPTRRAARPREEKDARAVIKPIRLKANSALKMKDIPIKTDAPKAAAKTSAGAATKAKRTAQRTKQAAEVTASAAKRVAKATAEAVKATGRTLVTAVMAGGWAAVIAVVIISLFGTVAFLFPGESSDTGISDEVYAYQSVAAQYAEEYGIREYVPLILAVMMQESGGLGPDPMQASACGYNTLYPDGIADPNYSIQCGVHYLADCLSKAGTEGPADLERIRLALQGYNYGTAYISWALRSYGGYSAANAAEYSEMMKAQLGTAVYGDPSYVPHVLRYYSYVADDFGGIQLMLAVARGELGYREGENGYTKYGDWYGIPYGDWCAMFLSWCADQAGMADVYPRGSSCAAIMAWYQERGLFLGAGIVPPVGAYILFDNNGDGIADHIGIVEYSRDGFIHTIEGNSSNQVKQNTYAIDSNRIMGYGYPLK